jgi:hypothetical protein
MSDKIPHISPVLLKYCPQGGATIGEGPNREKAMKAGSRIPPLTNVTEDVCNLGDASCALLHTLNAMRDTMGFYLDPRIIEPNSESTLGIGARSVFTSRFSKN